jgi:DNA repair exonuclease SbcCD ATPase subunit
LTLEGKVETIKIVKTTFDENDYQANLNKKARLEAEQQEISIDEIITSLSEKIEFRDKLAEEINDLEKKIASVEGALKTIPKYSPNDTGECPLCGSVVDSEHIEAHVRTKREKYTAELNALESQLEAKQKSLKAFISEIRELKDIQNAYNDKVQKLQLLEGIIARLTLEKASSIDAEANKKEKQRIVEKINELKEKIQEEQTQKDKLSKMRLLLDNQETELTLINSQLQEVNNEISQLNMALKSKEEEISRINEFIKGNKEKIQETKQKIADLEKQSQKYKVMLDYLECIKKITKEEGVRNYAIQHTIPFLTRKANEYLSMAGCSFFLKLDSQLNAEVRGPGIVNATFGSLSSGQQKVTNLAMLLSFLDLFKLRSPIATNILLLDEVLDSAIDSTTLTQMMAIIEQKQKSEHLKCFIVSHRKEISEVSSFDNIYRIEKVDGFSRISKVAA